MENTNAPTPTPHAANPAVVAVVVTYNRLELLRRNLDCLRTQTHPLAGIVVVNNGSTDGTEQWLDSQTDLTVITQDNCGGAGGFARGLIVALHLPAAWLWCMDDDVFPRPTCLEELLRESARQKADILAPRRLVDGRVVIEHAVHHPVVVVAEQILHLVPHLRLEDLFHGICPFVYSPYLTLIITRISPSRK